jgi:hypothetical protein
MKASVNRLVLGVTLVLASALAGCESPNVPPPGPEETCARACAANVPVCNQKGCRRGCNLILDRLAEHEGDTVLSCVAKTQKACDDRAWAHCAARVGVHIDGGPPAPLPPSDEEEDEDTE